MNNLIYNKYEVYGLNLGLLLNELKRKNVEIKNAKKINEKTVEITIPFKDTQKFFAICKNMCYNYKKKDIVGFWNAMLKIIKRPFFFIGALCFIALSVYANNYVFKIELTGDGEFYKKYVEQVLMNNGVKTYSIYDGTKSNKIKSELLKKDESISFVSLKKSGYKLIINVVGYNDASKDKQFEKDIFSTVDGEVMYVSLLRGTKQVEVGDVVKKGDLLIGGYYITKNEERIETYSIGKIVIKTTFNYEYASPSKEEKYIVRAKTVAKNQLGDKNILQESFEVEEKDKNYLIKVNLVYQEIIGNE